MPQDWTLIRKINQRSSARHLLDQVEDENGETLWGKGSVPGLYLAWVVYIREDLSLAILIY